MRITNSQLKQIIQETLRSVLLEIKMPKIKIVNFNENQRKALFVLHTEGWAASKGYVPPAIANDANKILKTVSNYKAYISILLLNLNFCFVLFF